MCQCGLVFVPTHPPFTSLLNQTTYTSDDHLPRDVALIVPFTGARSPVLLHILHLDLNLTTVKTRHENCVRGTKERDKRGGTGRHALLVVVPSIVGGQARKSCV